MPARKVPALPAVRKSSNGSVIKKNDEVPFNKWSVPAPPVGYLKYYGFDFF